MGDIIGLISGKGGVGKTTITACVGAVLSEQGYRVLLCDGDFGLRDLDIILGKEDEVCFDDREMPNMYDMLDALGAEYVGSILPYDIRILDETQAGQLIQDIPKEYRHMLSPVVDYIISGEAWDEQEIIDRFQDMTVVKPAKITGMGTLAQSVDVTDAEDDSRQVIYTSSWSTKHRLISGKESMWRRVRLK